MDDEEMKSDSQKTTTDISGVIVYQLEADSVIEGTLKFEVIYNDEVIRDRKSVV